SSSPVPGDPSGYTHSDELGISSGGQGPPRGFAGIVAPTPKLSRVAGCDWPGHSRDPTAQHAQEAMSGVSEERSLDRVKDPSDRFIHALQIEGLEVAGAGILDEHCGDARCFVPSHDAGMARDLAEMAFDVDIAVLHHQQAVPVGHDIRSGKTRR